MRVLSLTFAVPTGSVDDCIEMALESAASTAFLSDSGDNVTAGAAGDLPYMLERLLAHRVPVTLCASITDAAAVDACFRAGVGAQLELSLGGKLDPVHGQPLPVAGTVLRLHQSDRDGRKAILTIDSINVILTERRLAFTTLSAIQRAGA